MEQVSRKVKKQNKIKHKPSVLAISSLIVLILYSLILVLVLIWALEFSFVDYQNDIYFNRENGRSFLVLPSTFNFDNVEKVFSHMKKTVPYGLGTRDVMLPEMFLNTILYALGVSFFSTLAPCIMGYITAKFNFKFNKVIDVIVLVTMIIPIIGSLPAQIKLVYNLGIDNFIPGLWIMGFSFANMYYFVFKAIFKALPNSLYESASLDRASNFRIFVQIMFPLVRTTFLSVMVISFVSAWNNYTTPLAFAPNKPTVAYGLHLFIQSTRVSEPTLKMMAAMMLMVPILIAYACFNKLLMGNLTMGSVKG